MQASHPGASAGGSQPSGGVLRRLRILQNGTVMSRALNPAALRAETTTNLMKLNAGKYTTILIDIHQMSTVLPTAVLSPREVHDQIQAENPLVVDVREPAEYAAGHIPSAQIIPLSELRKVSLQWKRELPIILYCQDGARSEQARIFLALRGFTNHRG